MTDHAAELIRLRERATAGEWVAPAIGFNITTKPDERGISTIVVHGEIREDELPEVAAECLGGESWYTINSAADREFIAFCGTHAASLVQSQAATIARLRNALEHLKGVAVARQNMSEDEYQWNLRTWEVIQVVDAALTEAPDAK